MEEINTEGHVLCLHWQQHGLCSPGLATLVANTNMAPVESFQSRELLIATGQLVLTPAETLRMEANVPSYTTTSNQNVLKAKEISLRSLADHPKRIALNVEITQRLLTTSSW